MSLSPGALAASIAGFELSAVCSILAMVAIYRVVRRISRIAGWLVAGVCFPFLLLYMLWPAVLAVVAGYSAVKRTLRRTLREAAGPLAGGVVVVLGSDAVAGYLTLAVRIGQIRRVRNVGSVMVLAFLVLGGWAMVREVRRRFRTIAERRSRGEVNALEAACLRFGAATFWPWLWLYDTGTSLVRPAAQPPPEEPARTSTTTGPSPHARRKKKHRRR